MNQVIEATPVTCELQLHAITTAGSTTLVVLCIRTTEGVVRPLVERLVETKKVFSSRRAMCRIMVSSSLTPDWMTHHGQQQQHHIHHCNEQQHHTRKLMIACPGMLMAQDVHHAICAK